MELYKEYPAWLIFLRRTCAVAAGVLALPFMLFWKDRARFYSYLHRVWSKTSDKPVWMDQAEKATGDFLLIACALKPASYQGAGLSVQHQRLP